MSGITKPPGCDKNVDGDQLAALKGMNPEEMKDLINANAGEKCRTELTNSLKTALDRGTSAEIWAQQQAQASVSGKAGWSGVEGSASGSESMSGGAKIGTTNTSDEDSLTKGVSEGCRQTLFNMNNTSSLFSELSCNMKTSESTLRSDVNIGATMNIRTGPTEAMIVYQDKKVAGIEANISKMIEQGINNQYSQNVFNNLLKTLDDVDKSFRFDIKNSSFKITNDNRQTIIESNSQEIDDVSKIAEAIKKKAVSQATSDLSNKFQMGAQQTFNLESYVQSKIDDSTLSTAQDIVAASIDTGVKVELDGSLTLDIKGSLDGVNVDITQGNITELRNELIMKAAIQLGKDLAAEVEQEAATKSTSTSEGSGLADYQKAIADGLAAQAAALTPPSMLPSFGFGGMFGIAVVLIPLLLIIFLFYKYGYKIAGIALILFGIYLAMAYFIKIPPFSKEKNDVSEEIFKNVMNFYIQPRRLTLFNNFIDRVRNERNSPNLKDSYVQDLDNLINWMDSAGKTSNKLSTIPPVLQSAFMSGWWVFTIYQLELDTYNGLINMLQDLSAYNGVGNVDVKVYINPILPILIEEMQKLTFQYAVPGMRLAKVEYDLAITALRESLIPDNNNWIEFKADYNDWVARGRPSFGLDFKGAIGKGTSADTWSQQASWAEQHPTQYADGTVHQDYWAEQHPEETHTSNWAEQHPGFELESGVDIEPARGTSAQAWAAEQAAAQQQGPWVAVAQPARGTSAQAWAAEQAAQQQGPWVADTTPYTTKAKYDPNAAYESVNTKYDTNTAQRAYNGGSQMAYSEPMFASKPAASESMYESGGSASRMVQKEYSRKRGKDVKPVYNKNTVFKRS